MLNNKLVNFWLLTVPDLALFYAGLWMAILLRYGGGLKGVDATAHFKAFTVLFAFWLVVFFIHGLLDIRSLKRYTGIVFGLLSATVTNLVIAIVYFYFQPDLILTPRRFLLLDLTITFVLILAWHLLLKFNLKRLATEDVYLFSFNNELAELEREIKKHGYLGFKVLGHLCEQDLRQPALAINSAIILPDNLQAKPEVLAKFYEWRKSGVDFFNHREFYENLLRRVYISDLSELWFLENISYKEKRFYNLLKRAIDLIFGVLGLAAFLLSWPFCSLLIKLTSPGPVLFIQERVGRGGKIFKVYKYRTMSGGPTNTWTSVNDPRITKVGKFLRKSRIDEWPQFLNLLAGNLSLVGPRPEQPHIVEELKRQIPFYDERHLVKPGLTGWAQLNVYAGSLEETKAKLQYDLYYIKHRSLAFDLEIILKTLYYIFTWQGR
ncbi:MAG: exopolysaccharide biosynthesis polyprenyl glycosylphosphotransferase [Patescibacteria group bacterium]|nr:exopolysaccharide biosynthesis polyprenyl glycosylphosphotransferase [Patescibacteria group bacterium]